MANTSRRYIDRNGSMFIPMNVEGGSWNEHFMTTSKLVFLGLSAFIFVMMIMWLHNRSARFSAYIILIGLYTWIFQYGLRYIVFEEKLYYRMYKQLREYEITTPSIFWDITSIKDTSEGAILTYGDAKIGLIVKLERDTITGKGPEFKEEHYDAISDFYRYLSQNKYSFIQMNIMEQAGNDPRLAELDKLIYKNDNKNICDIVERQVGYIKNITHKTLCESDYVLIYTRDLTRIDNLVSDAVEAVYQILDGAFIGYKILDARDIIEFIKEEYGVKYFNYTEATLDMFKNHGVLIKKPFELSKIMYSDGKVQKIGNIELNKINTITSEVISGALDINKISIRDTLKVDENESEDEGIDFDSLSDDFTVQQDNAKDTRNRFTLSGKNDNTESSDNGNCKNEKKSKVKFFGRHSTKTYTKNSLNIQNEEQQNENEISNEFSNKDDDDEKIDF